VFWAYRSLHWSHGPIVRSRIRARHRELTSRRTTRARQQAPPFPLSLNALMQLVSATPISTTAHETEANNMVRARAAARCDIHYIDEVTAMLAEVKPKSLFEPDSLHMTTDGYANWTQEMKTALPSNAEAEALSSRQTQLP
jgi:lysophospholipase L1-like esterase